MQTTGEPSLNLDQTTLLVFRGFKFKFELRSILVRFIHKYDLKYSVRLVNFQGPTHLDRNG